VPIIATAVGGIPSAAAGWPTVTIVRPDARSLAAGIQHAVASRPEPDDLAEVRRRVLVEYGFATNLDARMRLYRTLTRTGPAPVRQRVFVDVGAHYGETLEVALDPRWRFDRVYSLEPARTCVDVLRRYRDSRIVVVPVGLSNRTSTAVLYDPGSLGASVYADKRGLKGATESIQLVRASTWLSDHTTADDEVYLKLNCEGSECDIIDDLLATGLISRVRSVYVDFDVRKIPSQSYRQPAVRAELASRGVDFATSATWAAAGNAAVSRWLDRSCLPTPGRGRDLFATVRYRARIYRPAYMWFRAAARRLLPTVGFTLLARRFGRYSRRNRLSVRTVDLVAAPHSGRE